ncbi:MAG: Adenine deaminase [Fimbriimonadaceae bacterium]|nr:Adenine deaminase [Fimbriimonadaceae bacterium]
MLATTMIAVMAPITAITHVHVLDIDSGRWIKDQTVLVQAGKIQAVGGKLKAPGDATTIDGKGKYLIPGLWDAHIHWYDQRLLSLFTANGVTSVRVMFGAPMHKTWRDSISSGALVGPNLEVAGPIVDGPKPIWPGSIACGTASEGKEAVERHKAEKWDFVKVYSLLPRDAYFAIADEAKKQGLRFEGHVPAAVTVSEASEAGQRTIEHLTGMLAECSARSGSPPLASSATPLERRLHSRRTARRALNTFDESAALKLAKTLKKNGTMICPTLTVLRAIANLNDPAFGKDARLEYMPRSIRSMWDPNSDFRFKEWEDEDWALSRSRYAIDRKMVSILAKEGVKLLAGTDCLNPYCMPGFSLHDELALMVECGVSPIEALRSATVRPAELVGNKELGRIESGQVADLVLLSADPLKSIQATTKIHGVLQGGKWHDRKSLDDMLSRVKKLAGESGGSAGNVGFVPLHCDH